MTETHEEGESRHAQEWRREIEREDGYKQLTDGSVRWTPEWHEYDNLTEKAKRRLRWVCADLLSARVEINRLGELLDRANENLEDARAND